MRVFRKNINKKFSRKHPFAVQDPRQNAHHSYLHE